MARSQLVDAGFIHRILVSPGRVNEVLDRLRAHGIHAQATSHEVFAGKTHIDWQSDARDVDLDFLRPDILPPKEKA